MVIPEYVTIEEVQRVCKELGIRDWTQLKETSIHPGEAQIIWDALKVQNMSIDMEDFCQGLEVELEHGLIFKDANVTNNHPLLTGKIVLAHFKESLDYYKRLEVAEIEGDLLKALVAKDLEKLHRLHKKLAHAKLLLSKTEAEQLLE